MFTLIDVVTSPRMPPAAGGIRRGNPVAGAVKVTIYAMTENSSHGSESSGKPPQRKRRRSRRRRPGQSASRQRSQNTRQMHHTEGGNSESGKSQKSSQRRNNHSRSRTRPRGNKSRSKSRPSYSRSRQSSSMLTRVETSAGGLVVSGLTEAVREDQSVDFDRLYVALIGRMDRRGRLLWSMPKGHVEQGEDFACTAEREVWEETGIFGEVIASLGVIDYWFVSDGVRIHKTVHHHLLRYVDGELNDEDPEVTEVAWVPAAKLMGYLAYADERKLAHTASEILPELARKEKAEGRITPR